jgi:DNA polymerase
MMPNNLIRNQYLSAMGVDVWVARETASFEKLSPDINLDNNQKIEPEKRDISSFDWDELHTAVSQCQQCDLHKTRKNSLLGSGNKQAELFIVGSCPSNEEDNNSLEFVGAEGILLDNILLTLKLSRDDVYTTNLVKCKSQNHRDYSDIEMTECLSYIERQIQLVKPKIIILFGEQTAQFILKTNNTLNILKNSIHNYSNTDILVVVIEHPEQLLSSGSDKKQAWVSLLKIKTVLTPKN